MTEQYDDEPVNYSAMKGIGDLNLKRYLQPKKQPKGIHSELHEFIEQTRKEWGDTLPFGRWLGALKGVPLHTLYMVRGSIRDSNAKTPAKLFFWKIKELKKPKKDAKQSYPQSSVDKSNQKV